MTEQMSLAEAKEQKVEQVLGEAEDSYWAIFYAANSLPSLEKDYILAGSSRGTPLNQAERDKLDLARRTVVALRNTVDQVNAATTVEEVMGINWVAP